MRIASRRPNTPPTKASSQWLVRLAVVAWCALNTSMALAAPSPSLDLEKLPPPAHRTVEFVRDIQPILSARCVQCHGVDKQSGGLRLDEREEALKGGENHAPDIKPKNSADSPLIHFVAGLVPEMKMPRKGDPLTPEQVGLLRAWIDQGANWPNDVKIPRYVHWSLRPVERPPLPLAANHKPRFENPIDAFVAAKLDEKKLAFGVAADRSAFIRRIYLVMEGLPPTPEEVRQFVHDTSSRAVENLVDWVLGSPRYGERWARHWLDIARFAESNGFETNRERKNAYPYRDYVIQSLNDDKPYDQFVREQIAGDAFGADAGTGFLVAGAYDIVKSPDINLTLTQRQDELADIVGTTGTAFLGLTLGCARCHDHKFDPISQKDFYAVQAVFAGVNFAERPLRRKLSAAEEHEVATLKQEISSKKSELASLKEKATGGKIAGSSAAALRPAVNEHLNEETFAPVDATSVRFTILATTGAEPCIDELEVFDNNGVNVALAAAGTKPSASGTLPGYAIHKLEHLNDGLFGNSKSWISDTAGRGWVRLDFPGAKRIQRIVWSRDRESQFKDRVATEYRIEAALENGEWVEIASSKDRELPGAQDPDAFLKALSETDAKAARDLRSRIGQAEGRVAQLSGPPAWLGAFSQPKITHRLYRGDPLQEREEVAPDAVAVLGSLGLALDEPEQQRRIRLAEWIASPRNPLTARVMVNRIWHYIFGTGIVDTPSDFGVNGSAPVNPALLDWLADEFVRSGWSIKHIQRLILLSRTFGQSSAPRPEGMAVDADARLLWRFPPRRLEAEAIRDCMLAVSGAIDLHPGGPGFYLQKVEEDNVYRYFPKETYTTNEFRRMVYLTRIRQEQDPVFGAFDCPSGNQVMPRRSRSNTPLQALNLFNSNFVLQQAELLAGRLRHEAGEQSQAQVVRAFELMYGREPDRFEREASKGMIRDQGLEAFCRALYNTSEFLFVF